MASDLQVRRKWHITRKATHQSESQKLAIQVIGGTTLSAAVVVYTVITREPTLHPECIQPKPADAQSRNPENAEHAKVGRPPSGRIAAWATPSLALATQVAFREI